MSPIEYVIKVEEIEKEIRELEKIAGVSEKGERVREGPYFPLHAFDMEPCGTVG